MNDLYLDIFIFLKSSSFEIRKWEVPVLPKDFAAQIDNSYDKAG